MFILCWRLAWKLTNEMMTWVDGETRYILEAKFCCKLQNWKQKVLCKRKNVFLQASNPPITANYCDNHQLFIQEFFWKHGSYWPIFTHLRIYFFSFFFYKIKNKNWSVAIVRMSQALALPWVLMVPHILESNILKGVPWFAKIVMLD